MKKTFVIFFLIFSTIVFADGEKLLDSSNALQRIIQNKKIPKQVIDKTVAIAVFPNVHQVGFLLGGFVGKGIIVKKNNLSFSEAKSISIKGGSLGLQIGYQNNDMIFCILNHEIANDIYTQKITIGVDASIAIWDISSTYMDVSDIKFTKDIYVFSTNKGIFAGISFGGSSLSVGDFKLSTTPYALQRWQSVLNMLVRDQ